MINQENQIRIIIADDHDIFRIGLKASFNNEKDFQIVAVAENSQQAIELVRQYQPSILLLDIKMPDIDGCEATKLIKKENPSTFVVMLTAAEHYSSVDKALESGADGYLIKDIKKQDLIQALYKVMNKERVFSKSVLDYLDNRFYDYQDIEHAPIGITRRERDILNLTAFGHTNSEIAEKLFLSERTVETHRYNIMKKLGIKNISQLVRYALIYQKY
jgi:two-component system, NarL family, response regulator DegU